MEPQIMPQPDPSPISFSDDTIVAISTPPGSGGIAVIRISGPEALEITGSVWRGQALTLCKSHTAHLGKIVDETGHTLDEVVVTIFLGPNSYTGDDTIEITCHGSRWIQREIVNLLIRNGARGAAPGEFSQRAFVNGRIDLAQAEGIVDLIASSSRAAQRLAMQQANGVFSKKIESLRQSLIDFASLLELELDFSEEDVEFADRNRLSDICSKIITEIDRLADTYAAGKAFKEGVPVVIAGQPNAGKSTLLNRILNDDKAIVSDIPGTTRDIIEDTREINGTLYRFVDTAGLHETEDVVERIGIDRASQRLKTAAFIIWTIDSTADPQAQLSIIEKHQEEIEDNIIQYIAFNKTDRPSHPDFSTTELPSYISGSVSISASEGTGVDTLLDLLLSATEKMHRHVGDIMVTNARHYDSLIKGGQALKRASLLITDSLSADLIAQDVREALHHLAEITGSISSDTLLTTIFSRFCIGK